MTESELLPYLTEAQVVGLTIWAKARNQSIEGQIAVACVIRNRARNRRQTMRQVCLAPYQFSCWNKGTDANHLALLELARTFPYPADPFLRQCMWIVDGLISGALRDVTLGADHYLTIDLFETCPPSWSKTMPVTRKIGDHIFLKGA